MVEVDEVIAAVPKQRFKVLGTRDPSKALNERTINFFVIKDPTQAFCREDLLEVYKGVPTFDQRRKIHPVRIGDPKSGTDFAPRH